jgi:hypothetical protein
MAKGSLDFNLHDFASAFEAVALFRRKLHTTTDTRLLANPCIGVGLNSLCLESKADLPGAALGHVDLPFASNLGFKEVAATVATSPTDAWAALAGAMLNLRDIERNGANRFNEVGLDHSMNVVTDLLRAHFSE